MNRAKLSRNVWQDIRYFIAFGFGSGLMPKAPGTWGTLAAIPLYLLMTSLPWPLYLALTVVAFLGGVLICNTISTELGVHDHSGIVWDEIVGYWLTMLWVPVHVSWMVMGFLLFRLFDIWKPMPISYVDRHIKGGLGIMLDDVLAAIPAWVILQVLLHILPAGIL